MIIQNLKQLNEKYGENIAETIVENCSIQAFIKSTSKETAQSFEDKLGTKTITKRSAGVQDEEGKPNISTQAQPLLTKNQLLKLQSGEMVIVRGVKATDQKGNKITPDPIFVHGDLEMPYRFMFLQEEFDMDMTLSDIPVKSLHRGMKLSDVVVDGGKSFDHLQIWSKELQKERLGTKSGQDILPKLKTRYAA
ncbi:TraM recognition domain-containing protein [Pseudolactococcus yaeyamensis]